MRNSSLVYIVWVKLLEWSSKLDLNEILSNTILSDFVILEDEGRLSKRIIYIKNMKFDHPQNDRYR